MISRKNVVYVFLVPFSGVNDPIFQSQKDQQDVDMKLFRFRWMEAKKATICLDPTAYHFQDIFSLDGLKDLRPPISVST